MKNMKCLIKLIIILIIFSFLRNGLLNAAEFKLVRIGKMWDQIVDSMRYRGLSARDLYYYDNHRRSYTPWHSMFIGCRDWIDINGTTWDYKISGWGLNDADEVTETIPIPDENGFSINGYRRNQPPSITVDGFLLQDPFPLNESDHVDVLGYIGGTSDFMGESVTRTSMGVTIHQKAYASSQNNHDDYIIYDLTFTNTGNIDLDDEIELNQTIKDWYYLIDPCIARVGRDRPMKSAYGEHPGDSTRFMYNYPSRGKTSNHDDTGYPHNTHGFLRYPAYYAEAVLFASKSAKEPTVDDPAQPQMTAVHTAELPWNKVHSAAMSAEQRQRVYNAMQFGFDTLPMMDESEVYPNTHHQVRMEDYDIKWIKDFPWWVWHADNYHSCGPYTLEPGESVRIVRARVYGCISPEKGWEVGRAYFNQIEIEPPEGMAFGVTDNMPPHYKRYPEFYAADIRSNEYNNWAKDCWVFTGKDSLFQNVYAAQWAVQHDYDVPIPPPAPSVEVTSLPNKIVIEWGDESKQASDFAGYRVYRAQGNDGPTVSEEQLIGTWDAIFECGEGTGNTLTNSYEDTDALRGQAYYYYVTAFDNGIGNAAGVFNKKQILESGMYLNMTSQAAYLTREPGESLADIEVVPNPFNISAGELQFIGEPDKIMFMNLPMECTISIYTESGDLVRKLDHYGSGDESWGIMEEEHSANQAGMIISSGIYLAYIETPDGSSIVKKFLVIR